MNFRFAIPSYNRLEILGQKSLKTLKEHNVPNDMIDIFVVKGEYDDYVKKYPDYKFHLAPKGMKEVRNYIFQEFYDEGDFVVSMDDDIDKFRMKNPLGWEPSSFKDEELDLLKEIQLAFHECGRSGRHLWGVSPTDSHLYMKNDISYDYKFCGGWFWGCIVDKTSLLVQTDQYEDYERCMRHYINDGGMVRLNYICCKTNYRSSVGGMGKQRDFENSQKYLKENYPNLFYLKKKKDGLNPVLKDTREKN